MWFIYILECSDHTFYTGITTDLDRRLIEHNNSHLGAKYTRARRPNKLIYWEKTSCRSAAQQREHQIKKLSREKKLQLINEHANLD